MARSSNYNKQIHCNSVNRLAAKGFTEQEIADLMGISLRTLNYWKEKHPEFLQALKEGKEVPDDAVERSLFERATGYEHEDTYFSNYQGEVTATTYQKHYPPDPTSMIFWLKNRRPERWRDKQELTGPNGETLKIEIEVVNKNSPNKA